MATSSSLIKTMLHRSLAQGVYRDIVTRSANYYYYLGRTLTWTDESSPPVPIDSYNYEREARSEIITMKQINPTDVSFVVDRVNWQINTVYDIYDDRYSDEVIGINVVNGGSLYTSIPTITLTGGGGSGASFSPQIYDGKIIGIDVLDRGQGYTSAPTVTVTGGGGSGAVLEAVVNIAPSGAQKLEEANYYVVTDEYNVYKCLDNNNGAKSTEKPLGSQTSPIRTADGYLWKFLYNIPINLRNKFLTEEHMPVVSALTNQFYSNGSIDSIVLLNKGSGYTTASLTVSGDGYLESDPTYLTGVVVSNGGSGYSSPTMSIQDPVSDASSFNADAQVFLGQKIYNSTFDFYECVTPGTMSGSEPTHRYNIVSNGTASLKYIGTRATGTVDVNSDGEVEGLTLNGMVRDVTIVNPGSGYILAPSVTISGGGGSGATGVAKLNTAEGSVIYVILTDAGQNFTSDPDITFGEEWQASTAYQVNDQIFYSNRLYTVTTAGTTSTTAPTHTTGAVTDGTAVLTYAGEPATGTCSRKFGAGYSTAPVITITEATGSDAEVTFLTTKSEAKILPVLDNGQIVGTITVDGGVGYTSATIVVSGDGDDAVLRPDLTIGNIQSLQANNEILTTPGTISGIKIISGGYGYGTATIEVVGDGTGATATATIDSASGRITNITMTNHGQGYTFANINITGNGSAATARAILSPQGGHGKNSPDELFARTLMFYSNVSTDLNQGVAVNNDYRQLGIIKNPKVFNSDILYNETIGSACYILQTTLIEANFSQDDNLTITRGGYDYRYRLVSFSSTYALVQSLDNDIPVINDTLKKVVESGTPPTFVAESVGSPTIDKYSGQLMFIDNKAGFTPSEDETVTLRTVLQF
jgi:hypothetical protein